MSEEEKIEDGKETGENEVDGCVFRRIFRA